MVGAHKTSSCRISSAAARWKSIRSSPCAGDGPPDRDRTPALDSVLALVIQRAASRTL